MMIIRNEKKKKQRTHLKYPRKGHANRLNVIWNVEQVAKQWKKLSHKNHFKQRKTLRKKKSENKVCVLLLLLLCVIFCVCL